MSETTAEDQALLTDAQRRLEEKRRATTVSVPAVRETVEQHMERLRLRVQENPIPARAENKNAQRVEELRAQAEIPMRHRIEIPDGKSPWHEKRAKLVQMLGNGFIVALTGEQGTGKTQMGSALIFAATIRLMSCRYSTALDFFMQLQRTYDDGQKLSQMDVLARFVKPKLLVLDEMDERSASEWENRLLFHMINQRYNNLVDTVLISRESEETFFKSVGKSIQSRIQETGGPMRCDWPSFREEKV